MKEDLYANFAEEWTQRLRDGKNIVHDYLAKPAIYKQIGDVAGKEILCIGCGSGDECAELMALGAKKIIGIDLSPALIEIAKKSFPDIEFHVMDMENLGFDPESFDLVVSSLTMHYVPSWIKTLVEIKKVLKKNGRAVVSTNHPIRFGAQIERMPDKEIFVLGYTRYTEHKKEGDIFGNYLEDRKIEDSWFRDRLKITYYNRPISSLMRDIQEAGLNIRAFVEPSPEEWVREKNESFYNIHTKIPLIMIFELEK